MSTTRPQIRFENVPPCLRDRPQWVVWRYVKKRDGKLAKIPYDPRSGREASSTDPSTWATYEEACEAWRENVRWCGIGYVFSADDPYCGVDLDDSIDRELGQLKPWGLAITSSLATYWEVSPGLGGVKLIMKAKKPGGRCRCAYEDGQVEIYDRKRFFTITGAQGGGDDEPALGVQPRQAALDELYRKVFGITADGPAEEPEGDVAEGSAPEAPATPSAPATPAPSSRPPVLTDDQILRKATRSRSSGGKFADLWAGNWQVHFPSASEADGSLVFRLAFYTKDRQQLDRLFRASGLMREKWDERRGERTYGQDLIDDALTRVTAQWQPKVSRSGGGDGTGGNPKIAATPDDWQPTHLSQQVNAERLVHVLAGDARYDTSRGRWLWFDARRFADDHDGRVARAAKRVARHTWRFVADGLPTVDPKTAFKHAVDSEKAAGIAAMMKLAETEPDVPVRAEQLDAQRNLFNCLNGTIDLETGELRPHARDHLLTKLAPVAYDPAASRPLFDAFILRVMGGNAEMVSYLARVLGRCLSGDVSEQELYFFLGEGANGKSVLVDTVLGVLGDYAGTAPDSLLTVRTHEEHPTEIADLCGKRLVVASETEEGARLKVQLVKRLTGDGRLKARFMRQDFFEFDRTHKLVIVSNNRPLIRETKHAIWRRIRLVPFDVIIPENERDPHLTQKLKAEWPGILAWLVEGYRDWRQGGMRTPEQVLVATQAYQDEQDPLGDYLNDRCILGTSSVRVSRNDLYGDYQSWCQQVGEKQPLARPALFDHVRAKKGVTEDKWRITGVAAPVRGFRGIGLAYTAAAQGAHGPV